MRLQPNRDYISDDVVQTPPALARALVEHFKLTSQILEPCAGDGNFLRALRAHARLRRGGPSIYNGRKTTEDRGWSTVRWTEIKRGRDFFDWTERVDWIITNAPWSQIRRFLQQAMMVADHVVFLLTINHVWTKARVRDIRQAGFGIKEIVLVDTPQSFPQSGFQLGAVHLCRGWKSKARIFVVE